MVARPRFEPAQTTYDSAMVMLLLTSQPPPKIVRLDKYPQHFKEDQYDGQQ